MTDLHLDDDHPLMSSAEVATRLGMSREQVWRLWTTGRLPGYKLDRHLRFARRDVVLFLDQHYSAKPKRHHVVAANSYHRL